MPLQNTGHLFPMKREKYFIENAPNFWYSEYDIKFDKIWFKKIILLMITHDLTP